MEKDNEKDKQRQECRKISENAGIHFDFSISYYSAKNNFQISARLHRHPVSRFINLDPRGWGPNALRCHSGSAAVNVVCEDVFVVLKVAVVEVALSVDVALAVGVILFLKMMIVVVLMLMLMLMLKFKLILVFVYLYLC